MYQVCCELSQAPRIHYNSRRPLTLRIVLAAAVIRSSDATASTAVLC